MSTLGLGRERPADYINICNTIVDSYPSGLAHGLQKDAIQNAVDARIGKSLPVKVTFSVVHNNKGIFLIITDQNTTGLTGDVVHDAEDYLHLKKEDHWARFESFAFTKEDIDALGARGQGKFIFLCASEEYKMFYDTLRKDGVHRLGATQAKQTGCPIHPGKEDETWEDAVAREKLLEHCGLTPLKNIGTRIIICNPRQEVLQAVDCGEMERAIQETWFRSIQKNQLEITLCIQGKMKTIDLPDTYALPKGDSDIHKVWILGKDFKEKEIRLPSGDMYKIKNFHAAYLKEEDVPEALQGISLIQNGMKITSLPMDIAPRKIKEKITGYVEFDKALDRELRKGKNQHPNHYDLKWRSSLPRGIKAFIASQLDALGKQKLGLSEDPRERKNTRRSNSEELAMRHLQQYARDLNLFDSRKPGPRSDTPPPAPPDKDMGLSFKHFLIPNDGSRVNWEEQITFSLWGFNKTLEPMECRISLRVFHADTEVENLLDNQSIVLVPRKPKQVGDSSFALTIDKLQYKVIGEYRVKATLIEAKTGREIDSLTRRFWVQTYPPVRQPFRLELASFPEESKLAWAADVPNMMLRYNINHPEYRSAESDEEKQTDYLFKICLEGALQFVLERSFENDPDYTPLDTKNIMQSDKDMVPEKTYAEAMAYISEARWKFHEDGDN